MKKLKFLNEMFWLLVAVSANVAVFNSCGKDDDNDKPYIQQDLIRLDRTIITLAIGMDYALTAIIMPENATNKTVIWSSNANGVASVDAVGKVTAVAEGTAVITVKSDRTAICTVVIKTIPANGVLINGVIWSKYNVDTPGTFAATPESAGKFYQWNKKKAWSAAEPGTDMPMLDWDTTNADGNIWIKAKDPSPAGWRVPAYEEIKSLEDEEKVSSEWVVQNGVSGRKFTDIATGNTLFLPAAGYRNPTSGALTYAGSDGYYWSRTYYDAMNAYVLYFFNSNVYAKNNFANRTYGYSVRCVSE